MNWSPSAYRHIRWPARFMSTPTDGVSDTHCGGRRPFRGVVRNSPIVSASSLRYRADTSRCCRLGGVDSVQAMWRSDNPPPPVSSSVLRDETWVDHVAVAVISACHLRWREAQYRCATGARQARVPSGGMARWRDQTKMSALSCKRRPSHRRESDDQHITRRRAKEQP